MVQHDGVDFSYARPNPTVLRQAGKTFACIYGGPGSIGKQPPPSYVHALCQAGVSVVALAEQAATSAMGGRSVGVNHAQQTKARFAVLGKPAGRPVFFAVDWDVTEDQWPQVVQYFRGIKDVMPLAEIGIYGGYRAIQWAVRDGIASWFFQTYAWSAGKWVPNARLRQIHNNVTVAHVVVDLCLAVDDDFGQWMVGQTPTPTRKAQDVPGLFQVNGNETLYSSDGFKRKALTWDMWQWFKATWGDVPISVVSDADALTAIAGPDWASSDGGDQVLTDVHQLVTELKDAPMIDAVAVARAIEASPEIASTIARAVALQLGSVTGSLTLSGTLMGGINPPAGTPAG